MSTGFRKDRNIERQTDRLTDRKTERQQKLFRMWKKVRKIERQTKQQTETDRKPSSQNSRAAKEPALVLMHFLIMGEVLCILNSSIKKQPYEIDIQWIFTENILFPIRETNYWILISRDFKWLYSSLHCDCDTSITFHNFEILLWIFCRLALLENKSGLFSCPAIPPYGHSVTLSAWRTVYLPVCLTDFLTSCWHSEQLLFW